MKKILALLSLMLSTRLLFGQEQPSDLIQEQRALYKKFEIQLSEISDTALNGGLKKSNQKLVELAKQNPSVAMDLLVANMLFSLDPESSYALHKKAYESAPNDKATVLEWAMERHRKREYAEAAALYQKYLKAEPADETKQALLADCLVRIGKYDEAVAAWNAAEHPRHHTGIDFAICEIYGSLSPVRRRDDLLQSVQGGDKKFIEKLVYLDVNYDRDWWNSGVNQRALKSDMELAGKLLGTNSLRFQDLLAYTNLATNEEVDAKSVQAVLGNMGLILGGKNRLPENSLIAQDLVEKVVRAELATKTDLLLKFEKELATRAKSKPGDSDALNLLCFLYIGNDAKLAEYDNYGWEQFGDVKFAGSYLAGLAGKNKLKADSPELKKALAQFPEDGIIREIQFQALGENKIGTEPLVAAIKAEYRKLSFGLAIPDSYKLKALFYSLSEQLHKK